MLLILSFVQVEAVVRAKREGKVSALISPDLGLTTVEVIINPEDVLFPDGERMQWEDIEKLRNSKQNCFIVENNTLRKIQVFSEYTNRHYSLMPTESAPTMLVAGFTMHRIINTNPHQDTLKKVATLVPVVGNVLDTATGLGYTAIQLAKTANHVTTIELDPAALEIARLNPWSRELFDNAKITQIIGDAFEEVQAFPDGAFSMVLHDPPTLSLAGDLYSTAFYQQVQRVLGRGGRMFHYVGNAESKAGGRVTTGVIRRLHDAGFQHVVRRPEAFGVLAYK